MPMKIIRDDITRVAADVIVNTANPLPIYTTGTDKAVYEAAGADDLLAERKKIGEIARGDIGVTAAFKLNAKYIIHVVGPWWEGGRSGEDEILRSCYRKSLNKAAELECTSIAIPLIASGANLFPKAEALQIALAEINRFVMENEIEVLLVVFDKKTFELSERVSQAVQAYVDQNYVDDQRRREYPQKNDDALRAMDEGTLITDAEKDAVMTEVLPEVGITGKMTREKLLSVKEESFQECLLRLMREKNLDSPDVYKAANLDRRMFSKILSDKDSQPKKKTVIAIAMALQLDIHETAKFLGKAGYALSGNNRFDIVIRYCIENHMFNIIKVVNPILFDCDLPELGSSLRD